MRGHLCDGAHTCQLLRDGRRCTRHLLSSRRPRKLRVRCSQDWPAAGLRRHAASMRHRLYDGFVVNSENIVSTRSDEKGARRRSSVGAACQVRLGTIRRRGVLCCGIRRGPLRHGERADVAGAARQLRRLPQNAAVVHSRTRRAPAPPAQQTHTRQSLALDAAANKASSH